MAKPILSSALAASLLAAAMPAFAADPAPSTTPPATSATPAPSAQPDAAAPPKDAAAPPKDAAAPPKSDAASPPTGAPAASDAAPSLKVETPAEPAPEKNVAQDPIVATRRAGFTVGVMGAFGFGPITGYPLDIGKRGKSQYLVDTGVAYGANGTFFLGGAITDWLVFGAGLGGTYSVGKDITMSGWTVVLHTEVFPLFWLGGTFHDLGLSIDTGPGQITGHASNKPANDNSAALIDSGLASRVAISAFWDGLRVWKLSAGPFVAFDYSFSPSLEQPLVTIGLRSALYVKAPTKSAAK